MSSILFVVDGTIQEFCSIEWLMTCACCIDVPKWKLILNFKAILNLNYFRIIKFIMQVFDALVILLNLVQEHFFMSCWKKTLVCFES